MPSDSAPTKTPSATLPAASTVHPGQLGGTWSAQPDQDTTITLSFPEPGHFTWKVTHQGQSRELHGRWTSGNGVLTLAQDQGPALVGNTNWSDEAHFNFKVPGAGSNDPGLTFAKTPH